MVPRIYTKQNGILRIRKYNGQRIQQRKVGNWISPKSTWLYRLERTCMCNIFCIHSFFFEKKYKIKEYTVIIWSLPNWANGVKCSGRKFRNLEIHNSFIQGRRKIKNFGWASRSVVGVICPPCLDWNKVNWSAEIWGGEIFDGLVIIIHLKWIKKRKQFLF